MAVKKIVGENTMRCVIIAGSPCYDIDFIKDYVKENDYVICADKGALYAYQAKITPNLVVSDFDSYSKKVFEKCDTVALAVHKDDTDTFHSVNTALEKGYKNIDILCGLGGRTDHTYANISILKYIFQNGGTGMLVSKEEKIMLLTKGKYCFNDLLGKTFSLFPFGCESVCVSYKGAEYPLSNYRIKSEIPLGISNVFISQKSEIEIYDGIAIFILNM